ncbi:Hypothetical predicted protein [Paramuricea clavata]|uniref:Uncharacterized protein n=1 Tax=Paramuricea clavata TaxID=317549 RepID=A0A7D9HZ54_PARCT|nr:Hypothetical predicted protein [Paramuricea clavata]
MLEEVIGMFMSLFSLFWSDTPRVSFREPTPDTEQRDDRWQPYINKEYENFDTNEQFSSVLINGVLTDYTRLDAASSERRSYWGVHSEKFVDNIKYYG